jgi:hypothetical protein
MNRQPQCIPEFQGNIQRPESKPAYSSENLATAMGVQNSGNKEINLESGL